MATKFASKLLQIKMSAKFYGRLMFVIFVFQLVVCFAYNTWFNHSWDETKPIIIKGFEVAFALFKKMQFKDGWEMLSMSGSLLMQNFGWVFKRSFVVWIILPMVMIYSALFDEEEEEKYNRGRQYLTPQQLNKIINKIRIPIFDKRKLLNLIPLGQVKLPVKEENKQTFVVGKPGSGKTNAFNQCIELIRKRNQKIIIHDFKGDYVETFYDSNRDLIFNPLDERSVGWCLFNDCETIMDIDAFGFALIPPAVVGDPFWNNAARDILVGVLYYCWYNNKKTNKDIWHVITAHNRLLYSLLSQTKGGEAGAKHLEDPDGKTATGVMSNLMQFVKVFDYMSEMDGTFSIREWIANEKEDSTIFITNYANLKHTLSPIISLFIQTAGNRLLSLSDDINRRVFFFLDEFGQLPNMTTIENLMTASRSKGGAVFIGVQDIGQIDKLYKADTRTTILNSASTRVIFNCKDHETAKFFSNDIGQIEFFEKMESQSLGMNSSDRINMNTQKRIESLVSPEDIQSLPDLNAFISIGHYDVTLSKWKYKKFARDQLAFIPRKGLDLINSTDVDSARMSSELEQEIKLEESVVENNTEHKKRLKDKDLMNTLVATAEDSKKRNLIKEQQKAQEITTQDEDDIFDEDGLKIEADKQVVVKIKRETTKQDNTPPDEELMNKIFEESIK